jgi:hypothetical protein
MPGVAGGCFCGAVRYEAAGECSNSMVCHCRSCRRLAGSPVVAWVTFPLSGFRFTGGSPVEFRSSPPVVRSFCGACGTPLTYRHSGYAEAIDISTCSLDEPERFPPTHHSWLSHDVRWVKFGDGLLGFQESRPKESEG